MCWNKGRLCWKIAKLFYFCHLIKLVRPETVGPYYVHVYTDLNSLPWSAVGNSFLNSVEEHPVYTVNVLCPNGIERPSDYFKQLYLLHVFCGGDLDVRIIINDESARTSHRSGRSLNWSNNSDDEMNKSTKIEINTSSTASSSHRTKIRRIQMSPYKKVNFNPEQGMKFGRGSRDIGPGHFTLWKRPRTHGTGSWVAPRAGLDSCGKSPMHRDSIPGPSSPQQVSVPPWTSHIPVTFYLQSKNIAKLTPLFWRQGHSDTCPHTCTQRVPGDTMRTGKDKHTAYPIPG